MSGKDEPKILLDCDVVIHFIKGQKIMELPTIFPGRFVMLDKVYNELMKRSSNFLFLVEINIFGLILCQPAVHIQKMVLQFSNGDLCRSCRQIDQ